MTTIYRRDGRTITEAEAIDEDGCVRDGVGVSVPLMFRDGSRRRTRKETRDPHGHLLSTSEAVEEDLDDDVTDALKDAAIAFHDGHGRPAGHRPGYCIPTDAELVRRRQAVQDAYEERARADAEAWRNPQPWAGAAALPAQVPDHLTTDALSALALVDTKEAAYREVEERDRNAWRNVR